MPVGCFPCPIKSGFVCFVGFVIINVIIKRNGKVSNMGKSCPSEDGAALFFGSAAGRIFGL